MCFLLNLSSPRVLHMKIQSDFSNSFFPAFCRSRAYIVTKSQDGDSMLDQQLADPLMRQLGLANCAACSQKNNISPCVFSLKNWCPDLQTYKSKDDSETNQSKLSQSFLEAAQEQYCLCAIARIDLWGHSFREMTQQELHVLWHLISISGFV